MFELAEMASDCEEAGPGARGLGDTSDPSPLGRTPSANHTLLCSRVRDAKHGRLSSPESPGHRLNNLTNRSLDEHTLSTGRIFNVW